MRKGEPPQLRRLPEDLRRRLDEEPVTLTLEYVTGRLGFGGVSGTWALEIRGEDAYVRKACLQQLVGVDALEELAASEPPPPA